MAPTDFEARYQSGASISRMYEQQQQVQGQLDSIRANYEQREQDLKNMYAGGGQSNLAIQQEINRLRHELDSEREKNQKWDQMFEDKCEEIETLKEAITKIFKNLGGHMKSDFFDKKGFCDEHGDKPCAVCTAAWQDEEAKSNTQALVLMGSTLSSGEDRGLEEEDSQIRALKNVRRQTRFIKKALDIKDEDVKKIKVKDLSKKMKEAQEEITLGGVEELLEEDTKEAGGFLKGIVKFFLKAGQKIQK